jgi:N-acetylmuramoyl-L-alanine amidase
MRVNKLVVHHSASLRATTTRDMIEEWHLQRGFKSIGYHKVIEADGAIKDGRSEEKMGAHALGANANSLGVCVVGNFEHEEPTPGTDLLVDQRARYVVQEAQVNRKGHLRSW